MDNILKIIKMGKSIQVGMKNLYSTKTIIVYLN